MNENELRLNNLVLHKTKYGEIYAVLDDYQDFKYCNEFKPAQVTKKILCDYFGFENQNDYYKISELFKVEYTESQWRIFYLNNRIYKEPYLYAHRLQNIYFALFNKEIND